MNSERLPEKDPGETVPLCWDFTDDLGENDDSPPLVISNPEVVISVDQSLRRGSDPDVADMLVGVPEIVGNQVLQAVSAGVDGVDYKVRCAVDVNSTPVSRLYKTSIIPVRVQ